MRVKGYVIIVAELRQLLESKSSYAQYLLNTIPYGSNYLSNGISLGYENTNENILFFILLKGMDPGWKIVLSGDQYEILLKASKEDNQIIFHVKNYDYERSQNIRGYLIRIKDLQKIKMTIENKDFFDLVPLGTNFDPHKGIHDFNNIYPKLIMPIHQFLYSRRRLDRTQSWYKINVHTNHFLLLSINQYEKMKLLYDNPSIICYNNPVDYTESDCSFCIIL